MPVNSRRSGLPVLLPTAGMEICRLYALGSLLFLIPGSPPYPFVALACVLTAGTLLGRGLSFVSYRRITSLLVYGVFCGLCVFLLASSYSGFAFWLCTCAAGFFFFRGDLRRSYGFFQIVKIAPRLFSQNSKMRFKQSRLDPQKITYTRLFAKIR